MIFRNWLDTRPKMLNTWTKCLINQKCPFSSAKKWHFERPDLRTDSKNLAKHSPKWFVRHLVHAFSIFGRVSSQFLKIMFLEAFWRRFTLLKSQKLKSGCGHSILVGTVQFFGRDLRYYRPKTYQKSKVVWDTFAFLIHPNVHST